MAAGPALAQDTVFGRVTPMTTVMAASLATGQKLLTQVDEFVQLRNAKERSMSVEVVAPDGSRPLSLEETRSAESFQLTKEGFYEIKRANGRHEMIAANPDRRESDLEVMSDDTISLWTGGEGTAEQQAASGAGQKKNVEQQQPYSLWWYVMLLVLAAVLAESVFASRYLGIEREAP